jgi:hypothetical protein
MSVNITTAFVKQYHANIERLLQQKGSKFRGAVRVESQKSEEQFWEQIGSVEASLITTRHGDSPQIDTPHDRRRCTLNFYDIGDMVDDVDKVQMLIDPTSTYVQNFVDSLNRALDDTIIDAFFGTAYTGKAGGTSTTFPSANIVSEDFGTANSALTIAKLIEAVRLLRSFHNDPEAETWYMAINAKGMADLLNTTQVTSADYNSVKALTEGKVDSFMGLKFIHSERIDTGSGAGGATSVYRYPVWAKSGMLLSIGTDIQARVAERPDKRFSVYAYAKAGFGAVRMQENKVIEVQSFIS